ncbi:G2/M phase-specific E3 ubiquitin-protein ligase-like isoform X2 [Epinephelus moara]|uniref:G2/M phase-specific E3 ubiquitin-protein ligase-like isoform X2 n=1 Tax=Epinephelus moara TaxID=300413 RepID=UPI00214E0FBD|nr:G2/M phase-specific E3 ubiquitin-protein ligase-like isoform X2 [Epinephelus moara]
MFVRCVKLKRTQTAVSQWTCHLKGFQKMSSTQEEEEEETQSPERLSENELHTEEEEEEEEEEETQDLASFPSASSRSSPPVSPQVSPPVSPQVSPPVSPPVSPQVSLQVSPQVSPQVSQELREVLCTLVGNLDIKALPPPANRINVVRADILESAFRAFRRKAFNPERKLDVVFIDTCGQGEGSVDNGGPTREFLTLLMKALMSSRFFVGPASSKNLGLDSIGLSRGTYKVIGNIISVSVVHGGVGPHVLSKRLLCRLTGETTPPVDLMEVEDEDLRNQFQKIKQAATTGEVQEAALEAASSLSLLGSLSIIRTLSDRDDIISSALSYYLEGRLDAPLKQLQEGMEALGVLQALREKPALRLLFFGGPPAPLTAEQVTKLFQVTFSVAGSSRRLEEERAVGHWRDWPIDVEGGDAVLIQDGLEPVHITLEDVLMFATGADRIPPLGFSVVPSLAFLHEPLNSQRKRKFPEANTCALIMRLPMHASYEQFSDSMISGIKQSPQFRTA